MKYILRLPTNDQYAYIEAEGEYESIGDALEAYNKAMTLIKGGVGLPDKEFDAFIQRIIIREGNHTDNLEKLSPEQYKFMKVVDRAMSRIDYQGRKELAEQDNHIKNIT